MKYQYYQRPFAPTMSTLSSPRATVTALRETADPSLAYDSNRRDEVVSSLVHGGKVLFYGPGGTGKTHEMTGVTNAIRAKGRNVVIVALSNEAAVRFGGKGVYRAFGFTVDRKTGKPRSKLDDLCTAVRRSNPNRLNDPLWDGKDASNEELKDYEYMKKYTLGSRDPCQLTDVQIISLIDRNRAKYKQLDCAEVLMTLRSDVFVIEEFFMIGGSLLTLMDAQARKYREVDEPFGGAGLLGCGDALQIRPINDAYVFETTVWSTLRFLVCLFGEYKRFDVKDIDFLNFLRRARIGELSDDDHKFLLSRQRSRVHADNRYRLCRTREEADTTNKSEFDKLKNTERYAVRAKDTYYRVVRTMSGESYSPLPDATVPEAMRVLGDVAGATMLRDVSRVAKGARVSITHNDRDKEVYNGFIGTVTEVKYVAYTEVTSQAGGAKGSIDGVYVLFDRDFTHKYFELPEDVLTPVVGETYTLTRKTDRGEMTRTAKVLTVSPGDRTFTSKDTVEILKTIVIHSKGGYAVGRTQFPLELCWGRTIHKSQGATLDEGVLILSGRMSSGQAYVGCSRFRCANDLVIEDGYERKCFFANLQALEFDKQIQEKGVWTVVKDDEGAETIEVPDDYNKFSVDEQDDELMAFLNN